MTKAENVVQQIERLIAVRTGREIGADPKMLRIAMMDLKTAIVDLFEEGLIKQAAAQAAGSTLRIAELEVFRYEPFCPRLQSAPEVHGAEVRGCYNMNYRSADMRSSGGHMIWFQCSKCGVSTSFGPCMASEPVGEHSYVGRWHGAQLHDCVPYSDSVMAAKRAIDTFFTKTEGPPFIAQSKPERSFSETKSKFLPCGCIVGNQLISFCDKHWGSGIDPVKLHRIVPDNEMNCGCHLDPNDGHVTHYCAEHWKERQERGK